MDVSSAVNVEYLVDVDMKGAKLNYQHCILCCLISSINC